MNNNELGAMMTFVVRLDGDPDLIKYADQDTFAQELQHLLTFSLEEFGRKSFWIELFEHAVTDAMLRGVANTIAGGYNMDDAHPAAITTDEMLTKAKEGKIRITLDYKVVEKPNETNSG